MPRPLSKGSMALDENKLIDLVKLNPELYDCNHENANNVNVKKMIWKRIAEQLDTPVDICKKTWNELKEQHSRDVKSKTDRRRSLRSSTSERNLAFLNVSWVENSNENSRASSNCGSPKGEEKRHLRSSSRSLSQLTAISETDLASMTSISSTDTVAANDNEDLSGKTGSLLAGRTPRKLKFPSEHHSKDSNEGCKATPQPADRNQHSRLFEPSHLASKEILQSAVNSTTPQRQSGGPNGRRMKKSPTLSDSTRAFFESMAITVSTFPQHVQAAMKVHICNIVSEAEYSLSSPKMR